MKINKKISALFIGLIITFSQVSAGLEFGPVGSASESYIINNATLLEGGNYDFQDYKERYILDLKKTAEKWGLKSLDIKLPWGESLKYTIDSNNTGSLVQEVDKIVLVSDANGNITIYPPSNSPFKEKYQYSYIIPGIENKWFELGDSTTGEKTYNNMYNVTNKGKNIVFTIKDYYGNNTYITSKLGENEADAVNICGNGIKDYYEDLDDGYVCKEKGLLEITKNFIDNNGDGLLTCKGLLGDLNCIPEDGEKVSFTFKSLNTIKGGNVSINNFSLDLIGLNTESFETVLNSCLGKTELTAGESCIIEYKIKSGENGLNENQFLYSSLEVEGESLILFEGNEYANSLSFSIEGGVDGFISKSCKEILDSGLSIGDGNYTIDTDGLGGNDPFDVYCDMTTDGGGWMRLDNRFAYTKGAACVSGYGTVSDTGRWAVRANNGGGGSSVHGGCGIGFRNTEKIPFRYLQVRSYSASSNISCGGMTFPNIVIQVGALHEGARVYDSYVGYHYPGSTINVWPNEEGKTFIEGTYNVVGNLENNTASKLYDLGDIYNTGVVHIGGRSYSSCTGNGFGNMWVQ